MKVDWLSRLEPADGWRLCSTMWAPVWDRIVSELAGLQDAAPPESPGAVVNPIFGGPYVVDTCCAAAVFAAEHRRTHDQQWRERADAALSAALVRQPFRGVSEPTWDVLGWQEVPESLPATGIAVDAYADASHRLGLAVGDDHVGELLDLLLRCRTEEGGFAHNALIAGREAADVQNATASALSLLGLLARGIETGGHPLFKGLDTTLLRLGRGQVASGFWPYLYPSRRFRLREALKRRPFSALFPPGRFDSHHGYGDVMHHLMTLYFGAGYFASREPCTEARMLASGWRWIRNRLLSSGEGLLSIDWTGDPAPISPQSSNTRDTNAYFLILGAIPRLAAMGMLDMDEASMIVDALLMHIGSNLMSEDGRAPCIAPFEGPTEIVRNVLPMFEQSVAWKGRLMTEVIGVQRQLD